MKKVFVWAPSNIALVKYWGKRDEERILPLTDSLSMTLSDLGTETSIEISPKDVFYLNDQEFLLGQSEFDRVFNLVNYLRSEYGVSEKLKITSQNNFPTAAGLASSASGMAALVFAFAHLFVPDMSKDEMSRFARQGSGSACRSLWGGFVRWNKGVNQDGSDSYGEQLFGKDHWPELCMILNVVSKKKKPVSSREGMRRTVKTSSLYQDAWLAKNDAEVALAVDAIRDKDFAHLGEIVERNALLMHETMRDSTPSFSYLLPDSLQLIERIKQKREEGLLGYVTMDAGPQVKVLCLKKDVDEFLKVLGNFEFIEKTYVSSVGSGPYVLSL
jgi:diphosphomevalonate decarboxylase